MDSAVSQAKCERPVTQSDSPHHVVIIGGGFGGLNAARALRKAPVRITLLDRRNYHLFQPLLYQIAMGELSPANISAPLRGILRRQRNCEVLMAEAIDFDPANRRVVLSDGEITYDTLIVATGSVTSYYGRDQWRPLAPGLKTVENATEIRRRVLLAFERAERETDPEEIRKLLTFMVIGGGPTGVELAGALAEMTRHTLKCDFRHINTAESRIIVADMADRVLAAYPEDLSERACQDLQRLGVIIRTGTRVEEIGHDYVALRAQDQVEVIPCRTVLWAAGVQASGLARKLSERTGAQTDRAGRLIVEADMTVPGHPHIFVIGDMANYSHQGGVPLPGLAPVAIQQGKYIARLIAARLTGTEIKPFRYKDYGSMATIGRGRAIAQLDGMKFKGYLAWLIWLFIHLMQLIHFQNRLLVLIQWGWNYITFNRAARLITGKIQPLKERPQPAPEPASLGENPPPAEIPHRSDGPHQPIPASHPSRAFEDHRD